MSPYEITLPHGSVEHMNEEPSALWLRRVTDIYEHCIWLNPVPEDQWWKTPSMKDVPVDPGGAGWGDEGIDEVRLKTQTGARTP